MIITDKTITTCQIHDGFLIDVVEVDDTFEFWLYHESVGVKYLMFGLPKTDMDKREFINRALSQVDEYIDLYTEEYMEA